MKWWKRLGWWLLLWFAGVLVVACVATSPAEVFGDASGLLTVAYLAFVYGAATSPWMAWAFWIGSSTRKVTRQIDELLQPWIKEGLNWRLFWCVLIGGPLFTAAICWPLAHTFELLSMLAGIDAVLVVAIVVDSRSSFALVGFGALARTQTTLRLALLWAMALGLILAANGAIIAKSVPPRGVRFDLALDVSLGYGFFGCVAATLLLTLNASARLVEAHADAPRRGAEPQPPAQD